jgi:hypothetical protein
MTDRVVIFPYGGQVYHRAGEGVVPGLKMDGPESDNATDWATDWATEWAHPACGIPRRPGLVTLRMLAEESGRRTCRRCYA